MIRCSFLYIFGYLRRRQHDRRKGDQNEVLNAFENSHEFSPADGQADLLSLAFYQEFQPGIAVSTVLNSTP